jgi:hypothetical protein
MKFFSFFFRVSLILFHPIHVASGMFPHLILSLFSLNLSHLPVLFLIFLCIQLGFLELLVLSAHVVDAWTPHLVQPKIRHKDDHTSQFLLTVSLILSTCVASEHPHWSKIFFELAMLFSITKGIIWDDRGVDCLQKLISPVPSGVQICSSWSKLLRWKSTVFSGMLGHSCGVWFFFFWKWVL